MKVYISLGSNSGERKRNMELALQELRKLVKITAVSSLYESPPWGYTDQEKFLNAVVEIETDEEPMKLLSLLKGIEARMGRKKTFRWGPRIIDLDILFYDSRTLVSPKLRIPHPEVKNRAFVLLPLLELNSSLLHPEDNSSLEKMLNECCHRDKEDIKRIAIFNPHNWRWDETV
ncbi:MAG TPA: 2-amino-4-hydroxy-6-hydroxymethyldihydropteridine diphosphokinase [Candidatus Omnitrophica bacterium]|nr:2-amino-4-hydroxy-6-hydroxymethyldihydropteridine diphosphokinase [Candidatus Omnitrophota bacterium]